jgi:hypothetical protein
MVERMRAVRKKGRNCLAARNSKFNKRQYMDKLRDTAERKKEEMDRDDIHQNKLISR